MNILNRPAVVTNDQVDLFSLLQVIFNNKKVIALVAALFAVLAIVYAFFIAEPVYKVESVVRPPDINQLDAINRSNIYSISPAEALRQVGLALDSYDVRLRFYQQNPQFFKPSNDDEDARDRAFEKFNRDWLRVTMPAAADISGRVITEMEYPQGVAGADVLNGLVNFAVETELATIRTDMSVIVKNRLAEIEAQLNAARAVYEDGKKSQIATLQEQDSLKRALLLDELKGLRQQLKAQRTDRIAQLNESIGIAKALGIKRPSTPSSLGETDRVAGNVVRTEINNQAVPLYFMGSDALEAERAALMRRTTDDFVAGRISEINKELLLLKANRQVEVLNGRQHEDLFLQGVEPLRKEIVRLNSLDLNLEGLKLVAVDRMAVQAKSPFKPKRMLLVVAGLIAGVFMGMILVLLRHYLQTQRNLRTLQLKAPALDVIAGEKQPITLS
ncbi:Wzz/FepE/Etk N-terminal domain-containing protein [Pseudomonas wadenswilerensis]|uniref:Wzz/FepE/Etk N-terminal domain-containing protein n=1 Tax=Pseudomonas wadenswilerensis TaxID=1785161 RepID=UPI003208FB9D